MVRPGASTLRPRERGARPEESRSRERGARGAKTGLRGLRLSPSPSPTPSPGGSAADAGPLRAATGRPPPARPRGLPPPGVQLGPPWAVGGLPGQAGARKGGPAEGVLGSELRLSEGRLVPSTRPFPPTPLHSGFEPRALSSFRTRAQHSTAPQAAGRVWNGEAAPVASGTAPGSALRPPAGRGASPVAAPA